MLGTLPEIELKERPVLNSEFISSKIGMPEPKSLNMDTLMFWIKRTPECIGILKRIATDIATNIEFIAVESPGVGRPSKSRNIQREDRAKLFWRRNLGRQKLIAALIDWLATGDAYIWKGKLSENQVKEVAVRHYGSYGIETKEIDMKQFFDEDFSGITAIEVVPSSMVEIEHDEFKINKYVQKSKSNPLNDRKFRNNEIIHAKFMEIDGKIYGYTPMEASYTAILTINAIQDYGYNYFANGVKLDRAWKFMGNPSKNYLDKFEEDLKKYKKVRNAHGDLILAGADKIESERLNEVTEEMHYRQLAIHSVGRLAFSFNMPADILSSILGVDVRGTAMGSDIDDAGYNRNIINSQIYWESLLNSQLFLPVFKVEAKFERSFRQDQIRQVQYQSMAIPVVEFLFKHEYPISDEYIHSLLQIPRKYLKEGKITRSPDEASPFQLPNKRLMKGDSSQKLQENKKIQQKPQQDINPPLGS